jgi:IS1 family transposase
MNRLDTKRRAQIVSALVEGNSVRATCRMFDVAKGTVLSLLADLGAACSAYQDEALRDLPCRRIQCDEIWAFVGAKDKNVPAEKRAHFGVGSVWTWTALDADTKLMAAWAVGTRDAGAAWEFMQDLAGRLRYRVQLTTDGHGAYLSAVEDAFGGAIDFAQLVKIYGAAPTEPGRYSPPICTGTKTTAISGDPDPAHVSTSFVERSNLTMRMSMRRFTRLTNGFSKKIEKHMHAISLHFMHYNFARIHQTLRITPAMAAGVADHVWSVEAIVALLDASETRPSDVTKKGWAKRKSAK